MKSKNRAVLSLVVSLILSAVSSAPARALAADDPSAPQLPQAGAGCLDLSAFLAQIRALPDSLYMHHLLADLSLQSATPGASVSDLATQHALDLFYHPNLVTLGLHAAKNGGSYLHDFTAYQYDCAKVVTGDIFAAEGRSVIWEIASHSANALTLKRLSKGGDAEPSGDLTLVLRRFQALAPTVFAVTSAYGLKLEHPCAPPAAPVDESVVASVTELFVIDDSSQDPSEDPASDDLNALMAKYPRVAAPNGHRGEFAHPVTAQNDGACATPAAAPPR